MKRTLTCLMGALLVTLGVVRPAQALPLTNTALTVEAICGVFACASPLATHFDSYSFDPAPDPDGTLFSIVFAGTDPTTAGLYLYGYSLDNFAGSTELIHGLSVDFAGIVPPPTGFGFSYYCADCGGTTAPTSAEYDSTPPIATFHFLNGLAAGGTSTLFGAVSIFGPTISDALVLDTGAVSQVQALVPAAVPEPGSLLLLGTGLCGLVTSARRRARRVQQ